MSPLPAIYVVFHADEVDTVFQFTLPSSRLTQDVYRHVQKRIVASVLNMPRCEMGYDYIYLFNYFIYGAKYPNRLTEYKPEENDRPGESIQILYTSHFIPHKPFQVFMIQSLDDVLPVDNIGNECMSMRLTHNKMITITVPESWEDEDGLEDQWTTQMHESISQTYV
jgi:hypothetical protein